MSATKIDPDAVSGFIAFQILVPKQRIVDNFISACEGGSNYWCHKVTPWGTKGGAYASMLDGFTIIENEGETETKVSAAMIEKGVRVMAEKEPRHFGDMMDETGDATTGDVLLQCCAFGEVVYG